MPRALSSASRGSLAPPRAPPVLGDAVGVRRRGCSGCSDIPPHPLTQSVTSHPFPTSTGRRCLPQLLITTVNIPSEAEEGSVSAFRVRGNGNGDLQNQMLEFRILVCGLDVHKIWVMRCQGKQELLFILRTHGNTQSSVASQMIEACTLAPSFLDPAFYSRGNQWSHGSALCGRLGLGANPGRRCLWRVSLSTFTLLSHLLPPPPCLEYISIHCFGVVYFNTVGP